MANPAVKICSKCQTEKDLACFSVDRSRTDGHTGICKTCVGLRMKSYNATAETKARNRTFMLRERYGITQLEYDRFLAAQGGRCKICGSDRPGGQYSTFHVDHDHATGKVRGLLCHGCNTSLGGFKDDPELLRKAASYVEKGGT